MTGMMPDVIGHINNLSILDLSNNSISGSIPMGIQNLTQLISLTLSSNQLTGHIPVLPTSLTNLDVAMNFSSGNLPSQFGAPFLRVIILSYNRITGQIPGSICMLQNIFMFDLSNNFLQGELPRCFMMPNLFFLLLRNNRFSGEFPLCIQYTWSLAFIDLSRNKFYGALPVWIGDLENLRFLQLSHNMFHGNIPVNIANLGNLQYLNLAANNISGSIPRTLVNLKAMTLKHPTRIDVGWYESLTYYVLLTDILSLVMKHQELNYHAEGSFDLVGIDLSQNQLTGGIPDQVTCLDGLVNLNLSSNHLKGKIPDNVGDIKSVESLDFSRNNLSGEISQSLSDLTYLSSLDLSHNNFVGRIPRGSQLDTRYANNPSMYDGNYGLCGPPLQMNCSSVKAPKHGKQNISVEGTEAVMFFYFGLVSGLVIGLWMVFCAILFKRSWRVTYFHQADKLYDKAYVFALVTWARLTRQATAN